MIIELLIAILAGVLVGTFTGLTPGIHINLVTVIVVASSVFLLDFIPPIAIGTFIIAMAITHTFLDAVPGVYLGAPDDAQALNVLPGHRMLIKGQGHNAVKLNTIGSFFAVILSLVLFPLFILSMAFLYPFARKFIVFVLIIAVLYLVLREHSVAKKVAALVVFILAGVFAVLVFNLPGLRQPLFLLLSGLFGFSILLVSLLENAKIPEQKTCEELNIPKKNIAKATFAATGFGFLAAFLPGIGSSESAIVASTTTGDIGDEGFLVLVGGLNTANMLISVCSIYAIDKARNGAIIAINKVIGVIDLKTVLVFCASALIAAGLAVVICLYVSKLFCKLVAKVDYRILVITILVFITALGFYFDSVLGLFVLAVSTAIGIAASQLGIGKNHLMGCLIIPVLFYFLL